MAKNRSDGDSKNTLGAVENAFDILEHVIERESVGVTTLAEERGVPKTTLHSYLQSLESVGYLQKQDGVYRPTLRSLELGGRVRSYSSLLRLTRPEVHALSEDLDELVTVATREGRHRVVLYESTGDQDLYRDPIGHYAPLHHTATGKAILSELPDDIIVSLYDDELLADDEMTNFDTREELFARLEEVTDRGYSIEKSGIRDRVGAIGKPIVVDDVVLGAISVSMPKSRMQPERIETVADALRESVNIVEIKLADRDGPHRPTHVE